MQTEVGVVADHRGVQLDGRTPGRALRRAAQTLLGKYEGLQAQSRGEETPVNAALRSNCSRDLLSVQNLTGYKMHFGETRILNLTCEN